MNKTLCNEIVEKIKNLKKGTIFTVKDYLDKYDIDKTLYLKYSQDVIAEIRAYVTISEEDKGTFNGLPFNYRYVRK